MRHADTSSIVHAWDSYPIEIFPRLWEWIEDEVRNGELLFCRTAMDEILKVSPDCGKWLGTVPATITPIENNAVQKATQLKNSLGITDDKYHPKGVGENDLLIIASAFCSTAELISDEEKQITLPINIKKYKIPAVCQLTAHSCINFLQYIKSAGKIFG